MTTIEAAKRLIELRAACKTPEFKGAVIHDSEVEFHYFARMYASDIARLAVSQAEELDRIKARVAELESQISLCSGPCRMTEPLEPKDGDQ